jgi:hypothetical protein
VAVVILIIQMKKLHLERLGFQFRSASSISLEEGGRETVLGHRRSEWEEEEGRGPS